MVLLKCFDDSKINISAKAMAEVNIYHWLVKSKDDTVNEVSFKGLS
jgi:hypothetical protein